jgi:hypothetical protein
MLYFVKYTQAIKSFWIFAVQKENNFDMKKIAFIYVLALVYGCSNESKNKENDFIEVKDAVIDSINKDKRILAAFNVDSLSGYWFQPHAALVNITFTNEGTFIFNTFDSKTMQDQKITGTYKIEGNKVFMKTTNQEHKEEQFDIKINKGDYYIENEGFYLVKS